MRPSSEMDEGQGGRTEASLNSSIGSRDGDPVPWRRELARVLVVLPAYNEEHGLGSLLQRLDQTMHDDGLPYQIIVVDDSSSDTTGRIAAQYADYMPIQVERHEVNLGLGATIRDGLFSSVSLARDDHLFLLMAALIPHPP